MDDVIAAVVVVDENDSPVALVAAHQIAEVRCVIDQEWATPGWRVEALAQAHDELLDQLRAKGISRATALLEGAIGRGFGKRLKSLRGWFLSRGVSWEKEFYMSSSNGVSKDAFANSGTANNLATTYGSRATGNSNVLTPTLNRMATNPQGFGQPTINNMNTAATQTIGGATAGAVGGANQAAARTNNAGAYAPAAAQVAHDATAQLSDAALGVQNNDAMLKEQQRQQGLSGLEGMYNTNVGAGENALGLSNQSLNTANTADNSAFARNMKLWQTGAQMLGGAAMG